MAGDFSAALYLAAGVCTTAALGFAFPPLTTEREGFGLTDAAQSRVNREFAYCTNTLRDVNCACFASVAEHVLANAGPKAVGAYYANQTELARRQATRRC